MSVRTQPEPHIEVHKFYAGAVLAVAFFALVIQAFLNRHLSSLAYVELPLLVTLYFGLSRRNPASGLLLGMAIGLLQDGVSGTVIGVYGIAKTTVGYLASTIGARIDVEHPLSRFGFTVAFFVFHQAVLALIERGLLAHSAPFFNMKLLVGAIVNGVVAMFLFPALDRLRKSG
ncbi:MAG: rod shape-determining protein MreD [Candidatus Acidiferrales bacterium]